MGAPQQLSHARNHVLWLERLHDDSVASHLLRARIVNGLERSGEQEHRHPTQIRPLFDERADIVTAASRRGDIREDDVRAFGRDTRNRIVTVSHRDDSYVLRREREFDDALDDWTAVGQEKCRH